MFAHNQMVSSILNDWTIDGTLIDTTTLGQSGLGNNGDEGVLHIPQSFITGASSSDCLISYPGHLVVMSYPFAKLHLAYSIAPVNRVVIMFTRDDIKTNLT